MEEADSPTSWRVEQREHGLTAVLECKTEEAHQAAVTGASVMAKTARIMFPKASHLSIECGGQMHVAEHNGQPNLWAL